MDKQRKIYTDARSNAKRRGFAFSLTFDQFWHLMAAPCAYGVPGAPAAMGVDRMDSDQGYTVTNASPCCPRHNRIKSRVFTHAEMLRLVAAFDSARACGHGRMPVAGRTAKPHLGLRRQGRAAELVRKPA